MPRRSSKRPDATFAEALIQPGLSVRARLFLFSVWAKIAVDHFEGARAKEPNVAFADYLVSITSAAFAVDSFFKDLPLERANRSSCALGDDRAVAHQISDSLAHNFDVTPVPSLHADLHWLFQLRDNAVHYRGSLQALHQHPDGTYYQPLVGVYTPDASERAIAIAKTVILHCLDHPRSERERLVDFIAVNFHGSQGVDAFAGFRDK